MMQVRAFLRGGVVCVMVVCVCVWRGQKGQSPLLRFSFQCQKTIFLVNMYLKPFPFGHHEIFRGHGTKGPIPKGISGKKESSPLHWKNTSSLVSDEIKKITL